MVEAFSIRNGRSKTQPEFLKYSGARLNRSYLEEWIHEPGLEKEWEDALRAANISDLSIALE